MRYIKCYFFPAWLGFLAQCIEFHFHEITIKMHDIRLGGDDERDKEKTDFHDWIEIKKKNKKNQLSDQWLFFGEISSLTQKIYYVVNVIFFDAIELGIMMMMMTSYLVFSQRNIIQPCVAYF